MLVPTGERNYRSSWKGFGFENFLHVISLNRKNYAGFLFISFYEMYLIFRLRAHNSSRSSPHEASKIYLFPTSGLFTCCQAISNTSNGLTLLSQHSFYFLIPRLNRFQNEKIVFSGHILVNSSVILSPGFDRKITESKPTMLKMLADHAPLLLCWLYISSQNWWYKMREFSS